MRNNRNNPEHPDNTRTAVGHQSTNKQAAMNQQHEATKQHKHHEQFRAKHGLFAIGTISVWAFVI